MSDCEAIVLYRNIQGVERQRLNGWWEEDANRYMSVFSVDEVFIVRVVASNVPEMCAVGGDASDCFGGFCLFIT